MDFNALIRKLSSLDERLAELKARRDKVAGSLETAMDAIGQTKVETIYGYTQVKQQKVYDFTGFDKVAEAEAVLEIAKANLKAAQEEAKKAGAPFTVKRIFAFNRNKAVSARAKKNRIYVSTIISRKVVSV